ncbi:AsmA family protein [Xanthomonas citri pv. fuscans CFBP 6996]|uniref:AsmA family protein n=1 Tax=Xanthomonas citri TaxID=346 RepID=UPI000C178D8B|nr:AsmA family protein [Xanthomonas citri]ATS52587.2 AsmA family protein [Xanthomonas citri pv. phaseoli var. fuscans]ATS54467.2 AsmA family protein [Xanthomonas citri pv. phaseoli var. fuscans]ATS61532.2 AsmA family protein [Xanthomonas citri pv. phaseoli var. fuscans]PTY29193.1 AsmA family protein [Xanthomonas citri pv. fuscans CFBP 6996]QWN17177.1 AsmA family protein [Xanthomonas citri]
MNNVPSSPAPSPARVSRHRRWWIGLGIVAALVAIFVLLFDWNWLRGPVERAVSAKTGREFHLGHLDVDLGRITTVRGERLSLGNASWSKRGAMAELNAAEIDVEFWPLLRGKLRLPEIRLEHPTLLLEAGNDSHPGNWVFDQSDGDGSMPRLGRLLVTNGRLQYIDDASRSDVDVAINSLAPPSSDQRAAPIGIDGKGRWKGYPFSLKGNTASPLELSQSEHPFRIDLRGSAGATRTHVRGTLTNPFQFRVFDLQMALSGQDMEDLYPLIGVAMPSTPPYKLDGRLRRDGDVWRYEKFTGTAGDSDLSGTAEIDLRNKRPFLRADLASKRLDFDDLAGFVGAPPKTGTNESANAEQKKQAAQLAASARVLPTTPYDLSKLRSMDAQVRWRAQRINAPSWPLDDMDASLTLKDGLLQLDPLNFGVAGGDIRSTIGMDARKAIITTQLKASIRGIRLDRLFPDATLAKQASGAIGGELDLRGRGNSIAAMLGSADGSIGVGMGRGHVGNLIMELAGLDIAESLKYLLTKDRQIPVRCIFGDFGVQDGLMQSRALAFDSTDTIIVGEGNISLKNETLDLLLRPRPKDRSILSLRSPLRIGGTFKDPSFRPDFKALGVRGAIAIALGSIAPPAALLATFEPGPGKDSDCGGKYAQ